MHFEKSLLLQLVVNNRFKNIISDIAPHVNGIIIFLECFSDFYETALSSRVSENTGVGQEKRFG